jgi:hypothetical protein
VYGRIDTQLCLKSHLSKIINNKRASQKNKRNQRTQSASSCTKVRVFAHPGQNMLHNFGTDMFTGRSAGAAMSDKPIQRYRRQPGSQGLRPARQGDRRPTISGDHVSSWVARIMTDHVKAAHSLECAIILICDSINFIEEADISRITRETHHHANRPRGGRASAINIEGQLRATAGSCNFRLIVVMYKTA